MAPLNIEVRLNPETRWPPIVNIATEYEQEHVDDIRGGYTELKQQGAWREDAERKLHPFTSKEECERHAAQAVEHTLSLTLDAIEKRSWDLRDAPDGGHKIGPW